MKKIIIGMIIFISCALSMYAYNPNPDINIESIKINSQSNGVFHNILETVHLFKELFGYLIFLDELL